VSYLGAFGHQASFETGFIFTVFLIGAFCTDASSGGVTGAASPCREGSTQRSAGAGGFFPLLEMLNFTLKTPKVCLQKV